MEERARKVPRHDLVYVELPSQLRVDITLEFPERFPGRRLEPGHDPGQLPGFRSPKASRSGRSSSHTLAPELVGS